MFAGEDACRRAADQFAPTRRGEPGTVVGSQTQTSQNVYVIRIYGVTVLTGERGLYFVWLVRGDGRRNERKASRLLRVQHKFEFRFIDLFLVFSFPPTHPAIGIVYRIDCFIL